MDSNHRRHRQQIYSLPHLATLVTALAKGLQRYKKINDDDSWDDHSFLLF